MATPDPLAQLADIQQPALVSFWYERPFWWLLLGLVLIALVVAARRWYRHHQSQAPRREALALLATLPSDANASVITSIVKRYIKSQSPQSPLLAATPSELQQFLASTSPLTWPDLMTLHYQAQADAAALQLYRQSVKAWLMEYAQQAMSS